MEESKNKDLAEGSFFENWSPWVRWLLFIPTAIISPLLFVIIQSFAIKIFFDIGPNALVYTISRGLIYGGGFIFVGAIMAPNNQRAIAITLMIIVSMLIGINLFLAFFMYEYPFSFYLESVLMLISAGVTTHAIINELKD